MSRVGIIGDQHQPACRPGYRQFCYDIFEAWGVDTIVNIGDVVDWNAISFWTKHPDLPSPSDEHSLAKDTIRPWVKTFPKMKVTIGNHDQRVTRLAESVSIPAEFIRPYKDIWDTPGWEWEPSFIIDDVFYFHGNRRGGVNPACNVVRKGQGMSVVMGHVHTVGGIHWIAGPNTRWFGLDTGCGADQSHPAMRYAHDQDRRWILSCAVVIDGVPYHEIMPCGPGEKYHRSRFKKDAWRKS